MADVAQFVFVTLVSGALLSLVCFAPLWGPNLVFRGLVSSRDVVVRTYSVVDALVLMFYVATANACLRLLQFEMTTSWRLSLSLATTLLSLLVWFRCQQFMRECGLVELRDRLMFQTLVYPLSVVLLGVFGMAAFLAVSMLEVFGYRGLVEGAVSYFFDSRVIAAWIVLAITLTVTYLLRSVLARMLKDVAAVDVGGRSGQSDR